jgi:hypothetical protein
MTDEFTIDNGPGDYEEVVVDPSAIVFLLFGLLQSVHDGFVKLIDDLAEQGIVDPENYFLDEPVFFTTEGGAEAA